MIAKILGTFFTKIFNAVFMLITIGICTNAFGDEKYGVLSYIILNAAILGLFNGLLSTGIIYYASRINSNKLLLALYIWILTTAVVGTSIITLFKIVPIDYSIYVFIISLFSGIRTANEAFLCGRQQFKQFNLLQIIYTIFFTAFIAIEIFILQNKQITVYLNGYILATVLNILLSLMFLNKYRIRKNNTFKEVVIKLFTYGKHGFSANLVTFFTRRINYFIIENSLGSAQLGQFSAATQISESVGVFSKSVGLVNESETANTSSLDRNISNNIFLLKITALAAFLMMLVLMVIPQMAYIAFLGEKFAETKSLILFFSIGIVSFASNSVLNTFYAGIGKPQFINYAAITGLIATFVLGFIWIPGNGIRAAALVTASGQLINFVVIVLFFKVQYRIPARRFLLSLRDLKELKSMLQKFVSRSD